MKLSFSYTIEEELKRVQNIIQEEKFFKENGYCPILPDGIMFDNFSESKASSQIKKEFQEDLAKNIEEILINDWEKYRKQIEYFLKFLPYEKPKELKIIFTRYGMDGSYDIPNVILINLRNVENPFSILIHELLHLIIEEPVVSGYGLSQLEKESLVDYLFIESKVLRSIFSWADYQEKAPSTALLKKIGWDELGFERVKPNFFNTLLR